MFQAYPRLCRPSAAYIKLPEGDGQEPLAVNTGPTQTHGLYALNVCLLYANYFQYIFKITV
jgi:hypothetical protein